MKKYLLKLSGMAALVLLLNSFVFAQDEKPEADKEKILKDKLDNIKDDNEIVIRRKGDKDIKVTVEIKGNEVYVNGKPVTEFEDADVVVKKMQMPFIINDGDEITTIAPRSPF